MDALDEFFTTWCAPEAWCELCNVSPALHVVRWDLVDVLGIATTPVRVWEPATQTYIAICRRCCKRHIYSLGQMSPSYLFPSQSARPWRQRLWRFICQRVCQVRHHRFR